MRANAWHRQQEHEYDIARFREQKMVGRGRASTFGCLEATYKSKMSRFAWHMARGSSKNMSCPSMAHCIIPSIAHAHLPVTLVNTIQKRAPVEINVCRHCRHGLRYQTSHSETTIQTFAHRHLSDTDTDTRIQKLYVENRTPLTYGPKFVVAAKPFEPDFRQHFLITTPEFLITRRSTLRTPGKQG